MKKDVSKVIIGVVTVLVILFLINLIRNYTILKGICESNSEFKNAKKSYYLVIDTNLPIQNIKNTKEEVYFYDGIYLDKTYVNGEIDSIVWFNSKTNEGAGIDKQTNELYNNDYDASFLKNYERNILLIGDEESSKVISKILMENLFNPITAKDSNYVIALADNIVYIDKETKLINKYVSGDTESTYSIKKDVVTNEDVKKENLQQ